MTIHVQYTLYIFVIIYLYTNGYINISNKYTIGYILDILFVYYLLFNTLFNFNILNKSY